MRIYVVRAVRLCLLLVLGAVADFAAADFPALARDQTGDQLMKLMKRASAEDMIIEDIRVRTRAGRVLYNATFQRNVDGAAWVFLINISRARLDSAEREYVEKGYQNAVLRSVSAGGKRSYTAVWVRRKQEPQPLVLPTGAVPVSGVAGRGTQPLDKMMTAFVREHNVAGATVAVAKDGELVYSRGFGYSDVNARQQMKPAAVMRIASVSKPITSVAVMMLIQQQQLTLYTRVMPLLRQAGFPKPTADERWGDVTVGQLLHHTGGWDRAVGKDPMFQVVEATRDRKLKKPARQADIVRWKLGHTLEFDPGEKYAYSNFGYCLLGRVVAVVTKQRYSDWVAENILEPLGMKDTRLGKTQLSDRGPTEVRYHMQKMTNHSPFWASLPSNSRGRFPEVSSFIEEPYGRWDLEVMDSHGGWVSSAPDLLRFVAGLDSAEAPLLNTASRKAMLSTPAFRKNRRGGYWYGCGWSVRPKGDEQRGLDGHNIWHNGALAGTSALLVRRYDGFSWAVLFNTDTSSNGERLSGLVDSKMHRAVDSVSTW